MKLQYVLLTLLAGCTSKDELTNLTAGKEVFIGSAIEEIKGCSGGGEENGPAWKISYSRQTEKLSQDTVMTFLPREFRQPGKVFRFQRLNLDTLQVYCVQNRQYPPGIYITNVKSR